eukprot:3603469-Rhodomonas_salina.3
MSGRAQAALAHGEIKVKLSTRTRLPGTTLLRFRVPGVDFGLDLQHLTATFAKALRSITLFWNIPVLLSWYHSHAR